MSKSVNKVFLLGDLTRDPELRHTENKKPVCTFGLATNKNWTTETGKKREEPEYHRLVAWETLAEFCKSTFAKARKSMLSGDYKPGPIPAKTGRKKLQQRLLWKSWYCLTRCLRHSGKR
jgi:single-strand DNA-binding protein